MRPLPRPSKVPMVGLRVWRYNLWSMRNTAETRWLAATRRASRASISTRLSNHRYCPPAQTTGV